MRPSPSFIRLSRNPDLAAKALNAPWKVERTPRREGDVEIISYRRSGAGGGR